VAFPLTVPSSASAGAGLAAGTWEKLGYARKREGNFAFGVRWEPERGIRLLIAERHSERQALFELTASRLSGRVLTPSSPPVPIAFIVSDTVVGLDKVIPDAQFVPKLRESEWCFYLNQALIGRCAAPCLAPVVVYFPAERREAHGGRARFQPCLMRAFTRIS